MKSVNDRLSILEQIKRTTEWDLIIIGGGITGAGIFKLACQLGVKALLLESKDFAWGTSSRSSKMIHGGLRYLAEGSVNTTKDCAQQREKLLHQAEGLVEPLSFIMGHYKKQFPGPFVFHCVLNVYELLASGSHHRSWSNAQVKMLAPGIETNNLISGSQFEDGSTDDARLVFRLIQEGISLGGTALNYASVTQLNRNPSKVTGVTFHTEHTKKDILARSKVVISATGVWSKLLQPENKKIQLRPLRGSHLVIPSWRLPVGVACSFFHPIDKRPVIIWPWENMTLVGTTDVDHQLEDINKEPSIQQDEFDYLLAAVQHAFPGANILADDICSTFSGIRPVVPKHSKAQQKSTLPTKKQPPQKAPSKENRNASIWKEPGLITVAGGKLTTFHSLAQHVLSQVASELNLASQTINKSNDIFKKASVAQTNVKVPNHIEQRLSGRYGAEYSAFLSEYECVSKLQEIEHTRTLWAELVWACHNEYVVHLDDLLLRRTRLGLQLSQGGKALFEHLKPLCQRTLDWNDADWEIEVSRYKKIWQQHYSASEFRQPTSLES